VAAGKQPKEWANVCCSQRKKKAIYIIGVSKKNPLELSLLSVEKHPLHLILPLAAWRTLGGCWGQLNTFILWILEFS